MIENETKMMKKLIFIENNFYDEGKGLQTMISGVLLKDAHIGSIKIFHKILVFLFLSNFKDLNHLMTTRFQQKTDPSLFQNY